MKWFLLSLICLLALSGCSLGISTQGTSPPREIVIPRAQVREFLTDPPRSILLTEAINDVTQVWLDESGSEGHVENRTQTYSVNGCPLAGPPILAGDAIKVIGRIDEASGRFVAASLWILNVKIEGPCEGPPAE